MAVCKRCGTVFDYKNREGVCPKCCFYNRPDNAWQEDDSWIKNYNYEDNSYDISNREADDPDRNSGDRLKDVLMRKPIAEDRRYTIKGHKFDRELDGSHTHTDDGRVVRRGTFSGKKTAPPRNTAPGNGKPGVSKGAVIALIIWIYIILNVIFGIMR